MERPERGDPPEPSDVPSGMERLTVAASLALALTAALGAAPARAQDPPPDETTFSDATGGMWGVMTAEVMLTLGAVAVEASETCDGNDSEAVCFLMVVAGTALMATTTGLITGGVGAPPDVPFATHQLIWGGLGGFAVGIGLGEATGGNDTEVLGLGLTLGGLTGVGAAVYAGLRRDALMRDPDATVGAHLMSWGPLGVGLLTAAIAAAFEAEEEAVVILAGAMGLLTWGLAVGLTEASLQ